MPLGVEPVVVHCGPARAEEATTPPTPTKRTRGLVDTRGRRTIDGSPHKVVTWTQVFAPFPFVFFGRLKGRCACSTEAEVVLLASRHLDRGAHVFWAGA